MQKTKIIIALVAVATLTLAIVGLASAQAGGSQTYTCTSPNNGFLGWMVNCFGLEIANLTPTRMFLHQQVQSVQFPHQVKTTTMDLDRAGHDLVQVHRLFFFLIKS